MEKHYNIIDYQYLLILTVTEEESEALYEICFDLITCNIINEKPVLQSKTKPMLFHVDISQIESRYNEVITDGYSLTDIKEYIKQHIELNDKTVIILDDTNYEQLFEEFGCDIIPITMFTQILNPYDEKMRKIDASQFKAVSGCSIHTEYPEDCLVNKHGMLMTSFNNILKTLEANAVYYRIPHVEIKRKGFQSRADILLDERYQFIVEKDPDIINSVVFPTLGFIDDFTITSYFQCDICETTVQQFREHEVLGYKVCNNCFCNNPDLEVIKVDNQILKKEDFVKRYLLDED